MPRSEARIFVSIWDDEDDFVDLTPDAKLLYFFLTTQPNLGHCGVIQITWQRWARKIGWTAEVLREAITELDKHRYVVADEVTEELLVRALIRRDGVWKAPRVLRSALREAASVESVRIRAAIAAELRRLVPDELPAATRYQVRALLADLPVRLARVLIEPPPQPPDEPPPDGHPQPLTEPPAEPPAEEVGGRGDGNGSSSRDTPNQTSPSPPTRASAARTPPRPLWPAVVPGEGASPNGQPDQHDVDQLVERIRAKRPDWTRDSIRRAVLHPRCLERGWALTCRAIQRMAADPASKQAGRLPHDGPWWHDPPATRPAASCQVHHLDEPCRSCAADRKVATA